MVTILLVILNGTTMVLHCSVPCHQWRDTQQDNVGTVCRLLHTSCRGYKGECSFQHQTLDSSRIYGSNLPFCAALNYFPITGNRNTGGTHTYGCWSLPRDFRDWTYSTWPQVFTLHHRIPILYHYLCCWSSHIKFESIGNFKLWNKDY